MTIERRARPAPPTPKAAASDQSTEKTTWQAKQQADIKYKKARGAWQEAQSSVEDASAKVDEAKSKLDGYKTKLKDKQIKLGEKLALMQEAREDQRQAEAAHEKAIKTASERVVVKKQVKKADPFVENLGKSLQKNIVDKLRATEAPASEGTMDAIKDLIVKSIAEDRAEIKKQAQPVDAEAEWLSDAESSAAEVAGTAESEQSAAQAAAELAEVGAANLQAAFEASEMSKAEAEAAAQTMMLPRQLQPL